MAVRLQVKGRNLDVPEAQRAHADEKLERSPAPAEPLGGAFGLIETEPG